MINTIYKVIPLGELLGEEYNQDKLNTSLKKFSCQRETDLENFLQEKAILYERTNFGKTYLIIDSSTLDNKVFTIAAYFTIAQKFIDISSIPKKTRRKMLGECDSYSTAQLSGADILDECYNAISAAARIVGGKLIVLECREKMYSNFYEKQGFVKLYDVLN